MARASDLKAKNSAMAAYMKAHGIMRTGSNATLPAIEHRMKHAVNAGSKPPGGWNGSGRNAPLDIQFPDEAYIGNIAARA